MLISGTCHIDETMSARCKLQLLLQRLTPVIYVFAELQKAGFATSSMRKRVQYVTGIVQFYSNLNNRSKIEWIVFLYSMQILDNTSKNGHDVNQTV